jgi:hypothetical protein
MLAFQIVWCRDIYHKLQTCVREIPGSQHEECTVHPHQRPRWLSFVPPHIKNYAVKRLLPSWYLYLVKLPFKTTDTQQAVTLSVLQTMGLRKIWIFLQQCWCICQSSGIWPHVSRLESTNHSEKPIAFLCYISTATEQSMYLHWL